MEGNDWLEANGTWPAHVGDDTPLGQGSNEDVPLGPFLTYSPWPVVAPLRSARDASRDERLQTPSRPRERLGQAIFWPKDIPSMFFFLSFPP